MTDGTNESTVDTLEILEEGMTVEKAIGKCNDDKSIASSSTVDSTAGPVLDGKDEEDEGCLVWRILGLIALIILYAALIPVSCWALLILYDEQVLSGAVILGHFLIVLFAGGISIGVVHLTEFLLYLQLALRGVPFRSYNQMGCYLYYKTGYGNLNFAYSIVPDDLLYCHYLQVLLFLVTVKKEIGNDAEESVENKLF